MEKVSDPIRDMISPGESHNDMRAVAGMLGCSSTSATHRDFYDTEEFQKIFVGLAKARDDD